MMRNPDRSNRLAAILLCSALAFCVVVAGQEWRLWRFGTALAATAHGATPREWTRLREQAEPCLEACGARRAVLAVGTLTTLAAGDEPDARRRSDRLAAYRIALDQSRRLPDAGLPATLVAYTKAALDESCACAELAASYRSAPYLRDYALWRIGYGGAHWSALNGDARSALLREAYWYQRLGQPYRDAVLAALAGTPAYLIIAFRDPGLMSGTLPLPDIGD